MSLGDVFVYFPVLATGTMTCVKRKASSKLGKSAIKSGLFFFTSRECIMHIRIMLEISRQVRQRKEKYSHIALEFIGNDGKQPKKVKYKPKLKD